MTTFNPTDPTSCDAYLQSRTGAYSFRCIRYTAAIEAMFNSNCGLTDDDTVMDIGAGWTEFDYCLRTKYNWRGRYYPVDGGLDGTDLEVWTPVRKVEWIVGLEIIEHLYDPYSFLNLMKDYATKGIVISTPNPKTTDVLGMDPTHKVAIRDDLLIERGFKVTERMFYGGVFSNGLPDSLFGVWLA